MLVFDDNMLKLAKMQETLLKVSTDNKQENLKKYRDIVIEIDRQAFSSFLEELELVDNHNQTLEEELQFLEQIKGFYNQLYELQLNFKKVCDLYGDNELELSDLSQVDIEYIDRRISIINGYLVNLKNIDNNKKRLQELNDKLIGEEKNKSLLSKRLLDFEDSLRSNFENAEGRIIVDGQLQYISVVSEYKKLGYDFKLLLKDTDMLDGLLIQVNRDKIEIEEKLKTAEICYNTNPNADSKHILDDISKEFFRVRYRLTMLKMLELLSKNYDDYEMFKEKREKILDLIKYRVVCLKNLGERISIDPFARTKIEEQINALSSLYDNSKMVSKIKKEISLLSERVDEMIRQNDEYRIELNDTKDLVISTVSMGDIVDISGITVDFVEPILVEEKPILDNQVVSIGEVSSKFNMSVVRQKTSSVIKRVNQMVNTISNDLDKKNEIVSPELVIVSQPVVTFDDESELDEIEDEVDNFDYLDVFELADTSDEDITKESVGEVISTTYDTSMFDTVDPFLEAPLFMDKTEDEVPKLDDVVVPLKEEEEKIELESDDILETEESDLVLEFNENDSEMPDAFWVTQSAETPEEVESDDVVLSFDEQISALLSDEESTKIKKLVA